MLDGGKVRHGSFRKLMDIADNPAMVELINLCEKIRTMLFSHDTERYTVLL